VWAYRVELELELDEPFEGSLPRFGMSVPLELLVEPGLTFTLPLALPLTPAPPSRDAPVELLLEESGAVATRGESELALELEEPGAGFTVVLLDEPEGAVAVRSLVLLLELDEPGAVVTRSELLELDAPGPGAR